MGDNHDRFASLRNPRGQSTRVRSIVCSQSYKGTAVSKGSFHPQTFPTAIYLELRLSAATWPLQMVATYPLTSQTRRALLSSFPEWFEFDPILLFGYDGAHNPLPLDPRSFSNQYRDELRRAAVMFNWILRRWQALKQPVRSALSPMSYSITWELVFMSYFSQSWCLTTDRVVNYFDEFSDLAFPDRSFVKTPSANACHFKAQQNRVPRLSRHFARGFPMIAQLHLVSRSIPYSSTFATTLLWFVWCLWKLRLVFPC